MQLGVSPRDIQQISTLELKLLFSAVADGANSIPLIFKAVSVLPRRHFSSQSQHRRDAGWHRIDQSASGAARENGRRSSHSWLTGKSSMTKISPGIEVQAARQS